MMEAQHTPYIVVGYGEMPMKRTTTMLRGEAHGVYDAVAIASGFMMLGTSSDLARLVTVRTDSKQRGTCEGAHAVRQTDGTWLVEADQTCQHCQEMLQEATVTVNLVVVTKQRQAAT